MSLRSDRFVKSPRIMSETLGCDMPNVVKQVTQLLQCLRTENASVGQAGLLKRVARCARTWSALRPRDGSA